MIRTLLVLVLIFMSTTYPAFAQFANTTVPVNACNPAPGAIEPCYQSTPPPESPAAAMTATPLVAPSTQIPQGLFARISTSLLDRTEQGISKAINTSVFIGQWLLVRIAAISIILSLLGWYLEGESIARLIKIAYWRIIETFLWLTLIAWTWNGPNGLPGWFPTIIGSIAAIGASIANQVAGIPIATFQNYTFNFTVLPGTILDLGAALFGAIATLAWDTFSGASTEPGVNGALQNLVHGTVALVGGALTGTLFISGILYLLMMLSAVYVYFVCGWIAWRYFLAVLRVFVLACLSFLQGFGGSRRLSSYAGGFLSIAIVLGSEFALTTILVGIFYGVIMGLIQTTPIWPLIANIISVSGGVVVAPIAWAKNGISLGYLLLLDMMITAWALAMHDVPKTVSNFFAGRLSIDPHEAIRAAQSSPTLGGKIMGAAGATVQSFAHRGPIQATASKAKQVASYGLVGASTQHRGTTRGTATGAVRGGIVGGVTGAAAGAAGAWIAGRFIPTPEQDQSTPDSASSTIPPDSTATNESTVSSTEPSPSSAQTTRSSKKTTKAARTTASPSSKSSTDDVSTPPGGTPPEYASVLNDRHLGEMSPGQNMTPGLVDLAREAPHPTNPVIRDMQEWIKSKIDPSILKELDEIDKQMSAPKMVARSAAYSMQYRAARGQPPQRDEPSTTIPTPPIHFRG